MQSIYESNVDPLRPNDAHGISLQLVGQSKSVLELGAASGHVTKALKSLGNSVTAVERDGRFIDVLNEIADSVIITNLDWLDLRSQLEGKKFDVVLAGDVLEHCSRPDLVLLQLHDLLNPGGYVVISLPNIAHGDVRLSLLAGKFKYRDTGLLDRTHLRFFTRETINEFLAQNDFEAAEIFGSTANIGTTEFGPPNAEIPQDAIRYVQGDRDALVYQYIVKAVPLEKKSSHRVDIGSRESKSKEQLLAEVCLLEEYISRNSIADRFTFAQGELDSVQHELRLMRAKFQSAQTEQTLLETKIEALNMELQQTLIKLLDARDHSIGASAELGVMRHRYVNAQQQVDSLVHQLNLLHSSRTWRLGRFFMLPARAIRRVLRLFIS